MLQTLGHDRSSAGVPGRVAAARRPLAIVAVLLAIGLGAFLLGPRPTFEARWVEPTLPSDLDAYLEQSEAAVPQLRPGDGKEVVWIDREAPAPTPLSVVYLHGFSADRHEVEPLVSELGRELDANVYFARLRGHGRDAVGMGEATVEAWMDDAAEAVAIGATIGRRVILVGTSTGGTLALWTAAREEARDRLAAVVLISPNLGVQDPAAPVLLWPWGGALARLIVGPERCFESRTAEQERHWTTCYPTRALLPMMALVDHVRSLPESALDVPTLVVYSLGDRIVDPDATERVMGRVSTGKVQMSVLEGSTDPDQHVIAGAIMSPETTDTVRRRILSFLDSSGVTAP